MYKNAARHHEALLVKYAVLPCVVIRLHAHFVLTACTLHHLSQIKFVEDTTNCSFENVTYRETLKGGPEVPIVLAVANNKVRLCNLSFYKLSCDC